MTGEAEPTLLDVVSAAVDEATPTPASNPDGDSSTDNVDPADTDAGGDTGGADGGAGDSGDSVSGEGDGDDSFEDDGEVDETDATAVAAAEADGRARGADGKFIARTKEEKAAAAKAKDEAKNAAGKTPEQIAADVAAAKVAADKAKGKKEPDAVNDPIPANMKAETRQRMTSLIATVKDVTAKSEKVTKDLSFVMAKIEESTATPEQYMEVLGVVKLLNSGDVADKRKALEYLQNSAAALATQLGVVLPGVDVLSKHADLKKKVELGHISRADAEELAAARNRQAHIDAQAQRGTDAERETAGRKAAVDAGREELNALETELRAADPQYDKKRGPLIAQLQVALNSMHPSKWKAAFKAAYEKLPAATVARPTPKPNSGNQPLRANKTPAGGQARPAASMLEAVSAAVAQAQ